MKRVFKLNPEENNQEDSKGDVFCVLTGTILKAPKMMQLSRPLDYPSSWFEQNPNKKPGVVIPITGWSHQELKKNVCRSLRNDLEVDIAVEFLYNCLKKCEVTLEADWISYGIVIGRRHDKITPLSLLDVSTERSNVTDVGTADDAGHISDLSICLAIVGVYKIAEVKNESYKRSLLTLVSDRITANGGIQNFELATFVSNKYSWIVNATYKKLIAAIDMFFHKFQNNGWAVLRVGTKESRYKGCSAILSFNFIAKLLGLTNPGELLCWIFVKELADEAERFFKKEGEDYLQDEEHIREDSYFPYIMDLGISFRSPYAERHNPKIHFFCNIIGSCFSVKRCLNARMNSEISPIEYPMKRILVNAKLVAYVFLKHTKFPSEFVNFVNTSKEILEDVRVSVLRLGISGAEPDNKHVMIGTDAMNEPRSTDFRDWYTWLKMRKEEELKTTFREIIVNSRPGTIAAYINDPRFN